MLLNFRGHAYKAAAPTKEILTGQVVTRHFMGATTTKAVQVAQRAEKSGLKYRGIAY